MAYSGTSGTVTVEVQTRVDIATSLKQKFLAESDGFLLRIVAIDETWVRDFELEIKEQSSEWRGPSSLRPKKCRRLQSKVEQIMIFAYDHRGVIITDRVPYETSVTAAYYHDFLQKLRREIHKNRSDLLKDVALILYDNARPHLGKVVTDFLEKHG
ncbi:uncharacterized protein LOC117171046 [Belonocnema kinseyi]|uniref:uncharacterized protein LOC117171046 n=1 Tax=Belonocnema kinseyi TaxID=2817044 RepID=UPI00143D462E|nr:uncharacterized protein LOC117171046 [Belonocnema kinseyi]